MLDIWYIQKALLEAGKIHEFKSNYQKNGPVKEPFLHYTI
jgi:hypothetical protein